MRSLGRWLVILYLWEPILLKNWLAGGRLFWLAHMAFTVAAGLALIVLAGTIGRRAKMGRPRTGELTTLLLGAFCVWCLVASSASARPEFDMAYALTFGVTAFAAFYAMPRLLTEWGVEKILDTVLLPLKIGIVGSLVFPLWDIYSGRFCGMFVSPGAASGVFTLTCILLAGQFSMKRGARKLECGLWFCAALVFVLLCRVRGTSLALVVAFVILLRGLAARRAAAFVAGLFALSLLGAFVAASLTRHDLDRGLKYFRLRGDLQTIGRTRWTNWQSAIDDVSEAPLVGKGFASRWVGSNTRITGGKRGIRYDFASDPHNVWLTLAKSVGLPGAVLFGGFFLSWMRLGSACHRQARAAEANSAVPFLWAALMGWAFVAGLFENMLISFGAVGDRFAWAALSVLTFACLHGRGRKHTTKARTDSSSDATGRLK